MIVRPIEPGGRIHSIRLENPGPPVPDGEGGYTQSWTALRPPTAKARVDSATQQKLERIGHSTVSSNATDIVSFPYHSGVTTKTRILLGSRVLYVLSVDDPESQHVNTIAVCTEVVA
jgi:SPP1 family predicted phage head-tail adaptor